MKEFSHLSGRVKLFFHFFLLFLFLFFWGISVHRGVARNNYLGGSGYNRDMLNIIPKSIEYKIINFHISSYSCTLMNIKKLSSSM